MKTSILLALVISTLFKAVPAFAWGDLGHQITAEIAEQILNKDLKTKRALQAILGVEPLAVSATWPDHVREDERYEPFASYHFVTILEDGQRKKGNDAIAVFQQFPRLLTDRQVPAAARMIALRYLIHVIGDIHQPLHVGNDFDRGANFCKVHWLKASNYPTDLHAVWDTQLVRRVKEEVQTLLTTTPKYMGYKQIAAALMAKHKSLIASAPSVDFNEWIAESYKLSTTMAYPDQISPKDRPYPIGASRGPHGRFSKINLRKFPSEEVASRI